MRKPVVVRWVTGIGPDLPRVFFGVCKYIRDACECYFSGLIAGGAQRMRRGVKDIRHHLVAGAVCITLTRGAPLLPRYDAPRYRALREGILPRYEDNGSSCLTAWGNRGRR